MKKNVFIHAFFVIILSTISALAEDSLPQQLREWIPLIQQQNPDWLCPRTISIDQNSQARECNWIGSISFDIKKDRAIFTISGSLFKNANVLLPTIDNVTPTELSVKKDGQDFNSFTIDTKDAISIKLPKGNYELRGTLYWAKIPNVIPIPESYAIINYHLDEAIKDLKAVRTASGIQLESLGTYENSDNTKINVYRTITDGNPFYLDTKIVLKISGKPRTIDLGKILPENSKTIKIDSELSVSFSHNFVSAQVYQGDYEIDIQSILPHPFTKIELPEISNVDWPQEELWSWKPNNEFRLVEILNATSVNQSQVQLPANWESSNLMSVKSGTHIELSEKRRGLEVLQRDSITLHRVFWPKIDKSGFTVSDNFSGTINESSRINAQGNLRVGSAKINSVDVPVTNDPAENESRGIEIRNQTLNLQAISETDYTLTQPATGWNKIIDQLSIQLMIPPSWKLLHVSNASSTTGSWSSQWSVFDIFILLVITFFTSKLLDKRVAALLLVFNVISAGEFLAPSIFFTYLLFFIACYKGLGENSSNRIFSILKQAATIGIISTGIAYLIQSLSFAKLQFIQLIYPQLQAGTRYKTFIQEIVGSLDSAPHIWPLFLILLVIFYFICTWVLKAKSIFYTFGRIIGAGFMLMIVISIFGTIHGLFTGSRFSKVAFEANQAPEEFTGSDSASPSLQKMYRSMDSLGRSNDQSKVKSAIPPVKKSYKERTLQSGPSLPTWNWKSAHINFSGPIDSSHEIKFYIISSGVERILCLLRFILSLTLLAYLSKYILNLLEVRKMDRIHTFFNSKTAGTILVALLTSFTQHVQADYPNSEHLNILKEYLTSTQCKEVQCAKIDTMILKLNEKSFEIQLTAFSNNDSEIFIPGTVYELIPQEVSINGKQSSIIRSSNNYLAVKTSSGLNKIEVRGLLPHKDILDVSFNDKPLSFSFQSTHWQTSYKDTGTEVPRTLRITRTIENTNTPDSKAVETKNQTDTWIVVERDLDITDEILVKGSVMRIGNLEKTLHVKIPLQQNEKLLTAGLTSENKEILIPFPIGVSTIQFNSSIQKTDLLKLTATTQDLVNEVWNIKCADYINCSYSGLSPLSIYANGKSNPVFLPLPSEEVSINPKVLQNSKGKFLTIESSQNDITWGEKILTGVLTLSVKTTKQSNFSVEFKDPTVEIRSLNVNGTNDSRKFEKKASTILNPGMQTVTLEYSKPFSPALVESAPEIILSDSAGNITTIIKPSSDRWIIWLGGSYWGPAVIFWTKMLVMLTIVGLLKKYKVLELSTISAVTLSFALSFVPTIFQFIPLGWIYLVQNTSMKDTLSEKMFKVVLSSSAVISIAIFYVIIKVGLLYDPPSLITGNGSSQFYLKWFDDFIGNALVENSQALLPRPYVISLSMNVWRIITLALSLFILAYVLGLIKKTIQILKEENE